MNKKIIILVSFIILLCGCSSEVNLTIYEDSVEEEISLNIYENSEISKSEIKNLPREFMPAFNKDYLYDEMDDKKEDGVTYYNRTVTELDNGYRFTYSHKFTTNDYYQAYSVKSAFKSVYIAKDEKENTLTYSADSNKIELFEIYPDLDTITINIKSDLEVKDTNGQKEGNVYKWTFTKDSEQGLYIVYKLPEKENTPKQEEPKQEEEQKSEETGENSFIKWINEHPVLTAIIAIVIFIIGIKIISKININN